MSETFIFIVIRDSLGPLERGTVYEDDLDQALQARGLGKVSGGGSQLGDERPDGTSPIEWCGIDVDIPRAELREDALTLMRSELQRLGAPAGSELQYTDQGARLLDRLEAGGWQLRHDRENVHPGFGY